MKTELKLYDSLDGNWFDSTQMGPDGRNASAKDDPVTCAADVSTTTALPKVSVELTGGHLFEEFESP